MHPIHAEFSLFTYEDSDKVGALAPDFIPLLVQAVLAEMR